MKRCARCHEWKPAEEFPRNRRTQDGRHCYCKPCHNTMGRANRIQRWRSTREYHLRRRYGVTTDDVARMIEEQDGGCRICGRPDPEHVDHDHETGRVRGILCFGCNGGLGQFGDDVERLIAAIAYLGRDDELAAVVRERTVALTA